MKLFAQQGFGTGEKVTKALENGYVHGTVISPKDYGKHQVKALFEKMSASYPSAERLFDPQFYVSLMAFGGNAKLGKLGTGEYEYFKGLQRRALESEEKIRQELKECLEEQKSLDVTALIAPNLIIPRSFNSIEGLIAKNFIRNTAEVWRQVGDERPVYATLAIEAEALQDTQELDEFLQDLTIMDDPPDGFYIIVVSPSSEITPELVDSRTLAGWMLLNHALMVNQFTVINGYTDILSPFLVAAGGTAGCTGWWNNTKVFSLNKFMPSMGGRQPVHRYLSLKLLNSIRFDELDRIRDYFPDILNHLETDLLYPHDEGSLPANKIDEVMQTWQSLSSLPITSGPEGLKECLNRVEEARLLYSQIDATPGLQLPARSNKSHLGGLEYGLTTFLQRAQIHLS